MLKNLLVTEKLEVTFLLCTDKFTYYLVLSCNFSNSTFRAWLEPRQKLNWAFQIWPRWAFNLFYANWLLGPGLRAQASAHSISTSILRLDLKAELFSKSDGSSNSLKTEPQWICQNDLQILTAAAFFGKISKSLKAQFYSGWLPSRCIENWNPLKLQMSRLKALPSQYSALAIFKVGKRSRGRVN